MSCRDLPRLIWINTSVSMKPNDKPLARIIPTVLFPEPGMPMRVILDFIYYALNDIKFPAKVL
jgi:hypothetical protein